MLHSHAGNKQLSDLVVKACNNLQEINCDLDSLTLLNVLSIDCILELAGFYTYTVVYCIML